MPSSGVEDSYSVLIYNSTVSPSAGSHPRRPAEALPHPDLGSSVSTSAAPLIVVWKIARTHTHTAHQLLRAGPGFTRQTPHSYKQQLAGLPSQCCHGFRKDGSVGKGTWQPSLMTWVPVLKTHIVEGENQLTSCPRTSTCVYIHTHIHTYTHTRASMHKHI